MDRILLDLYADRNGYFQQSVSWIGVDLTGVAFEMDVRVSKDASGPPLIHLANVSPYGQGILLYYAGTATVAAHIAAGRLTSDIYGLINATTGAKYAAGDSVLMSTIWIIITNTTLQALPYPQERGDDQEFSYDVFFSASTLVPSPYLVGKFVVRAGVTIP